MTLVTHDGTFHADDVVAYVVLSMVFPEQPLIRTRDAATINNAFIAFDVGGGAFDHHQKGGNGAREDGTPYASAGLVWKAFGASLLPDAAARDAIERDFIALIDRHDTGGAVYAVSRWIGMYNPLWNEDVSFDAQFGTIATIVRQWFDVAIPVYAAGDTVDWEELAVDTLGDRYDAWASAQKTANARVRAFIDDPARPAASVTFDNYYPQWEKIVALDPMLKYVVYPSAGSWRVQCVPVSPDSRESRCLLPEAWRGASAAALGAMGVPATFVHKDGFIAGAKTEVEATEIVRLALEGGEG